jgi:hypothetical protein
MGYHTWLRYEPLWVCILPFHSWLTNRTYASQRHSSLKGWEYSLSKDVVSKLLDGPEKEYLSHPLKRQVWQEVHLPGKSFCWGIWLALSLPNYPFYHLFKVSKAWLPPHSVCFWCLCCKPQAQGLFCTWLWLTWQCSTQWLPYNYFLMMMAVHCLNTVVNHDK